MGKQIERQIRTNSLSQGFAIERKQFKCVEINIPTDGQWMLDTKAKAKTIEKKLNAGQANSSEEREEDIIEIDNLSGVIAEYACYVFLCEALGEDKVVKPSSEGAKNQIDIALAAGKRTIEVRSSCVKNGIDFALFAKPKDETDKQYFDVIGPYSNGYKPGEIQKDLYMRVLYCCEKKSFMELLEKPMLTLYITGGATKEMMQDKDIYQIKHLIPAGGEVEIESDYRVIPLGKSLDIDEFIGKIRELDRS